MIMAKNSNNNYVNIEDIKAKNNNEYQDIEKIVSKQGNLLYNKYRETEGMLPINFRGKGKDLTDYRIYGQTVDSESVGDKTANMFDGNWLQGYWKFNTGEWNNSSQYIATSIIDCTPNTDYTFSLTGKPINYGFIWYNQAGRRIASNYDHVEEGGSPTHYTATSPASAAFMAVNISREADKTTIIPQDVTDFMLVEGSVSSPYEPYGYRVPVIVEGKNLFDYDTITHGYRIQWKTGANYADETAIMSDFISVSENSTYATDTNLFWICYDTNKQYIGAWNGSGIIKSGVDAINSMTAISPCKFIRILSFGSKTTPISSTTMLNYGSTALPYEPYHAPITTPIYLPEPIKMVGDEAEYIEYGTQKMYRIGADDLDVTLPALPTVTGTNVLSVGTEVQPSKVYLKGKLKRTIYGWHVDPDILDSSNAVTYLKDAIGMIPASMGSSTFNYGSWQNAFFMPKPCMLKSNGKIDYYLDPNDYTKKLDGTASDISNPNYDGNAMMQWPKIWFKYVKGVKKGQGYFYVANYKADGNFHCWCNYDSENNEIDHFYTAIYNGTSFMNYNAFKTYVVNDFAIYDNKLYKCNTAITTAESFFNNTKWDLVSNTAPAINKMRSLSGIRLTNNNGNAQTDTTTETTRATANNTTSAAEWYIETFSDRLLINGLLVLMGKSLNTQAVFGRGLDTGGLEAKEAYVTGALNDKGLFWGVTGNGNSGVKVFGMENFWGCCWHRTAGLITNNHAVKLKLTYGTKDGSTVTGYNQTGNGYIDNGTAPYSNGYVQKMSYNKYGFIPAVVSGGNQSTYYADYHYQNENYTETIYALFGGSSADGLYAGAFFLALSAAPGDTYWRIAAASLSCKPLL